MRSITAQSHDFGRKAPSKSNCTLSVSGSGCWENMKAKTVQLMLVMHSASHLPCSFCYTSGFEYVKFIDTTGVSWEDLFSYKSATDQFYLLTCMLTTDQLWNGPLFPPYVSRTDLVSTYCFPFQCSVNFLLRPHGCQWKNFMLSKETRNLWGIFTQGEGPTNIEWKPIASCFPHNGICINYWWCLSLPTQYIYMRFMVWWRP